MPITISFDETTGSFSVENSNYKKKKRNKGKSLLDFPKNYTVIDIETTGLDPTYDATTSHHSTLRKRWANTWDM